MFRFSQIPSHCICIYLNVVQNKIGGDMPPAPLHFSGFFFGQFPCLINNAKCLIIIVKSLKAKIVHTNQGEEA